jgi:hypothetical protein
MSGASSDWRDGRREYVRLIEELARDWERRKEAKELAHKELREIRVFDQRPAQNHPEPMTPLISRRS